MGAAAGGRFSQSRVKFRLDSEENFRRGSYDAAVKILRGFRRRYGEPWGDSGDATGKPRGFRRCCSEILENHGIEKRLQNETID